MAPLTKWPRTLSVMFVPAMSRWTQSAPSVNSEMKRAAVMLPAGRPPVFLKSAQSDLYCSLYSSKSGNCHIFSPTDLLAANTASTISCDVPMTPLVTCPRAMTTAPVRVAMSTTRFAPFSLMT